MKAKNIISGWKITPIGFVLMLLAGIITILYIKVLSGQYIFAGPDELAPSSLSTGIAAHEQDTGTKLLWLPWIFSGMPTSHAFISVGGIYFFNFVAGIMKWLGLPVVHVFLLHLLAGAIGTFMLLRSINISNAGSILASTGFLLMPYTTTMLVHGHGSQMMTLAFLPWSIWALLRLYRNVDLASAALLAFITGVHLQRAHVQISYYIMMLTGLLFCVAVYRGYKDPDRTRATNTRFILFSAVAIGLGIAMALSLYLPVLNYTPYSIRGAGAAGGTGFAYATQWSFSFGETMTFLLPSFYGFGGTAYWGNMPFTDYPNYMGIILLLLAGWAVYRERTWFVITLAVGTFLAYLVSMGHNFFLYRIFYDLLPYFKKFRVPTMILVLTQFGVVTLAAIGFDNLLTWLEKSKADAVRKFWLGLGILLGGLLLIFLVAPAIVGNSLPVPRGIRPEMVGAVQNLRLELIRKDTLVFALIMIGAVGSLWIWLKGHISKQWLTVIIIGLSIVDLARVDQEIIDPSPESLRRSTLSQKSFVDRFLTADPVTTFLQEDSSTFRIYPLGNLLNENRWAAFGIESIGGYHPAKLANYEKFKSTTQFRSAGIFQMLNVKYLISAQRFQDPRFNEVFVGQYLSGQNMIPVVIYEFRDFLARSWFPQVAEYGAEHDDLLNKLMAQDYDPRETVYVTNPDIAQVYSSQADIIDADWNPSHIRLEVESDGHALLVISEVYYPEGWIARLDGAEVPIHEVNTILRGISVPKGKHTLTFDFEPGDLALGLWISRLATLLVLLSIVAGWAFTNGKFKFARVNRE
ncbi:YfhO family protein [Candidatus Neomarinimicrobiota bacterium]